MNQKQIHLRYTEKEMMLMFRKFLMLFFVVAIVAIAPSCNSNKIACPTYADSFPEKKAKKGKQEPQIPKATKPKSGILPPNAVKRKKPAN